MNFHLLPNYLKLAFRSLSHNKFFSLINLLGLSLSVAVCLLIFRYVEQEYSYDTFHEHSARIYRLHKMRKTNEVDTRSFSQTPYRLADELKLVLPDASFLRIHQMKGLVSYQDKHFVEDGIMVADSNILDFLSFNVTEGDPANSLNAPNAIILTSTFAEKYFGDQSPIGQTIQLSEKRNFLVKAVVEEFPVNSHLHFDCIIPMQALKGWYGESMFNNLGSTWLYTYAMTPSGMEQQQLEVSIQQLLDKMLGGTPNEGRLQFPVMPVEDIHLYSANEDEWEANGSSLVLHGSMIASIFILIIAVINFMNLSTARASKRAKEVGVRKVVGANRGLIATQFLTEAIVITAIGVVAGIALAYLLTPLFEYLLDTQIHLNFGWRWLLFIPAIIVLGLLSGSYPALYVSLFSPQSIFRSRLQANPLNAASLRKGLVVFQFITSIVLIASTFVVYQQLGFIQNKNLGFDKEQLLVVKLNNKQARSNADLFKTEMSQNAGVKNSSLVSNLPPEQLNSWSLKIKDLPEKEESSIRVISADDQYVETMGIQLEEGRNYSNGFGTDSTSAMLINQSAVDAFNLSNALGTEFSFFDGWREAKVVGVVEDYHISSLHENIAPVVVIMQPSWYNQLIIRLNPGSPQPVISQIEELWAEHCGDWPLEYSFMDERLEHSYRTERRLGSAFMYFSILAIIIACLGLFALAFFITEQRIKEIGIRKVLGASTTQLLKLLMNDFLKWVVLAFVIASPITHFLMNEWLSSFAFRVSVGWQVYLFSGVLTVFIATFTVFYQSMRTAAVNPAIMLRTE